MELTYEMMQAHMKKFIDLLPTLTPENKHKMAELHTADAVTSYPNNQSEADHVSSHHEVYRANVFYEPWPLYMMIDDRKKMVECVVREEARHPVTGELVKDAFKGAWTPTGSPAGVIYMHAIFELTLVDNEVKVKSTFLTVIDPDGIPFQNWKNLVKH